MYDIVLLVVFSVGRKWFCKRNFLFTFWRFYIFS